MHNTREMWVSTASLDSSSSRPEPQATGSTTRGWAAKIRAPKGATQASHHVRADVPAAAEWQEGLRISQKTRSTLARRIKPSVSWKPSGIQAPQLIVDGERQRSSGIVALGAERGEDPPKVLDGQAANKLVFDHVLGHVEVDEFKLPDGMEDEAHQRHEQA